MNVLKLVKGLLFGKIMRARDMKKARKFRHDRHERIMATKETLRRLRPTDYFDTDYFD